MTTLSPRREDLFFPLQQHFDKLFDEFFGPKRRSSFLNSKARSGYPKLDILETDGNFRIEVAVPGVEPGDIKVEVLPDGDQRVMRVSGKMSHDYQFSRETDFIHRELTRAKFQRIVQLPEKVKGDPKAVVKNGMLTLTWRLEKPIEAEVKVSPIKKE